MANVVKKIGLSLGADICWPIAYQEILKRLKLAIPVGDDTIRFEVERVAIEPFELRAPCPYALVIDRLTHWYHTTREWIKKATIMDGLYVFNNPWSLQSMEKQTTYCAMMRLGLPIPDTWMVPPKEYDPYQDLEVTLERYAKLFDLGEVGKRLGYPMYMKPYNGGGWVAVSKIEDEEALKKAYEQSGKHVMHLQKAIEGHDLFVRCLGLGPQTRIVRYDPSRPLHDRYRMDREFIAEEDRRILEDMALTINAFFGWDFNSCETLHRDGVWHPIDFANACPDSQVTSLHYHFPWLITANIRWSVFCVATGRQFRHNLNWQPYFDAYDEGMTLREKLVTYAGIARKHFEADRFEEFCAKHLPHVDEVAYEFFATDTAKDAVRQKVAALYPDHEIEQFTDLFWERIQKWRDEEGRPTGVSPKGGSGADPGTRGGQSA